MYARAVAGPASFRRGNFRRFADKGFRLMSIAMLANFTVGSRGAGDRPCMSQTIGCNVHLAQTLAYASRLSSEEEVRHYERCAGWVFAVFSEQLSLICAGSFHTN